MPKSLVRAANAWAFERPLTILLAAAAGFAVLAMPLRWPLALHALAALAAAVALGGAGYAAMRYPYGRARRLAAAAAEREAEETEAGQLAAADVSIRLRRADRHPDAPARAPIFASRDLGSPFMEVGAFAPPPEDEADAVPEGEFAEVSPDATVAAGQPEPVETTPVETTPVETPPAEIAAGPERADADTPAAADDEPAEDAFPTVPDATLAAFSPAPEPLPARVRAPRPSLDAMLERLQVGLAQRARDGRELPAALGEVLAARRDGGSDLRQALEELNRMAAARR